MDFSDPNAVAGAPLPEVPNITIILGLEASVKIAVNATGAERARLIDWLGHPRRLHAVVSAALDAVEAEQRSLDQAE
jgi:hypothetical protein